MKTAIVSFDHPYDSRCETICHTKITVEEVFYGGTEKYYNISYKHRFVDADGNPMFFENGNAEPPVKQPHPFACEDPTLARQTDGVIVVRNPLVEEAVKMLLMKDNDISRLIGKSCPKHYRRTIMHDLAKKWD